MQLLICDFPSGDNTFKCRRKVQSSFARYRSLINLSHFCIRRYQGTKVSHIRLYSVLKNFCNLLIIWIYISLYFLLDKFIFSCLLDTEIIFSDLNKLLKCHFKNVTQRKRSISRIKNCTKMYITMNAIKGMLVNS